MTCDEATEWTCGVTIKQYTQAHFVEMVLRFCEEQEIEVSNAPGSKDFVFKSKYSRDRVTKFVKEQLIEEFNLS